MKKKNIIFLILESIRAFLASFFGFLFHLFSRNKVEQKTIYPKKNKKLKKEELREERPIDFSSYHNESPQTRTNSHTNYAISKEELEQYMKLIFCEELEIEERDLTIKQKEFLQDLNEKIIPPILKRIHQNIISNEESLKEEIKTILKIHIEEQIKLEQKLNQDDEKRVIIPLLMQTPPKKKHSFKEEFQNLLFPVQTQSLDTKQPIFLEERNPTLDTVISPSILNDAKTNNSPIPSFSHDILITDSLLKSSEITPQITPPIQQEIEEIYPEELTYEKDLNPEIPTPSFSSHNQAKENSIVIDDSTKDSKIINEEIEALETKEEIFEQKDALNEEQKEEEKEKAEPIDFHSFNYDYQQLTKDADEEILKVHLEDKDYLRIEQKIAFLLDYLEKLKMKNLSPEQLTIVALKEEQLLRLKNTIINQKNKDIEYEENILQEYITDTELQGLQAEIQKIYYEHELDLHHYSIHSYEDLLRMNKMDASIIEKQLLKTKLRKASRALEPSFLQKLPFLRNRYFRFFTMEVMAHRHLKLFHSVLNKKTLEYEPANVEHIKKGKHAFGDAVAINTQNMEYLSFLENEAFRKYPELLHDQEYILELNHLKLSFLSNQEKMLKKKKMIERYELKNKVNVRKLKKPELL